MKIKNYIEVVKKNKIYVYVCIIFCGIAALIFSLTQPTSYESTLTLSVHKVNRQDSKDFQYDNYYAIQASELLGNSIVGWLESPNVIFEVYDRAELTPESEEIDKLVRGMNAKQISSHSIKVNFSKVDRERTEKISGSLVEVINDKVKELEVTGNNKNSFEVTSASPIINEKNYDPVLVTIIGLIGGLFVGLGLAFLFEYFKE